MSEQVMMALVVAPGLLTGLFLLVFFVGGTSNSNFESWVEARSKKKLAELEVKKIEAEHAMKCPRLTDTLRGR